MSRIVYSHRNGVHAAHLESVVYPPIARALESVDGWYVSHQRGGVRHMMFTFDEEDAVGLLELVARELAP